MDKVSIVVPVYNKEKDVKKCINSLVKQSYRDIEIVIIDDGSTDNSYDICNKYAKRDLVLEYLQRKMRVWRLLEYMVLKKVQEHLLLLLIVMTGFQKTLLKL